MIERGPADHAVKDPTFLQELNNIVQRGNATAKMLNRLDDRMLDDIGIASSDVSKAVHIFH